MSVPAPPGGKCHVGRTKNRHADNGRAAGFLSSPSTADHPSLAAQNPRMQRCRCARKSLGWVGRTQGGRPVDAEGRRGGAGRGTREVPLRLGPGRQLRRHPRRVRRDQDLREGQGGRAPSRRAASRGRKSRGFHRRVEPSFSFSSSSGSLAGQRSRRQAREHGSQAALAPPTLAGYRERYRQAIAAGYAQNPEPVRTGKRGRPRQGPARSLLLRLDQYEEDVLRFAEDFAVPSTTTSANAIFAW